MSVQLPHEWPRNSWAADIINDCGFGPSSRGITPGGPVLGSPAAHCEWNEPSSHSPPVSPASPPDLLLLCTWKPGIQRFRRRAPKTFAVLSASTTPNTNATWLTTSCCTEVTFQPSFLGMRAEDGIMGTRSRGGSGTLALVPCSSPYLQARSHSDNHSDSQQDKNTFLLRGFPPPRGRVAKVTDSAMSTSVGSQREGFLYSEPSALTTLLRKGWVRKRMGSWRFILKCEELYVISNSLEENQNDDFQSRL